VSAEILALATVLIVAVALAFQTPAQAKKAASRMVEVSRMV
jgi:uncharacterized protein YjeT (DUF2065 family)